MISAPSARAAHEFAFVKAFGPLKQALRRVHDRELAALGVSLTQARPLLLLHRYGPMRQRELAERLDIEGPTLVRLLDQIQTMGLVERQPDPDDQRAKTLHLSAAGAALAARALPVFARLHAALLADVTDEELAICLDVFERLSVRLGRDAIGAT